MWKIFCAVGKSKIAIVAPPSDETPPILTMPDDRVWPLRPAAIDADRVADLVVVLRRRVRVDVDLVRADGPRAGDERERVEALVAVRVDAEGERRRAVAGDDLAVASDEVREVADSARAASATPGSFRTFPSSDSGKDGGSVVLLLFPRALLPVTTASVFA